MIHDNEMREKVRELMFRDKKFAREAYFHFFYNFNLLNKPSL